MKQLPITLLAVMSLMHAVFAKVNVAHTQKPTSAPTRKHIQLKNFQSIVVGHNVDLTLRPAKPNTTNTLTLPITANLQPRWAGKTLILDNSFGRTPVQLTMHQLHHLTVLQNANVTLRNVPTQHLHINNRSSGHIIMRGILHVDHIEQHGTGKLEGYWIDSKNLRILGHQGDLHLAGYAQNMTIDGHQGFTFHGRHLRAGHIWAHASENAKLYVMPEHNLFAAGCDQGKIAYFQFLPASQVITQHRDQSQILFINPMTLIHKTKNAYHGHHTHHKHHKGQKSRHQYSRVAPLRPGNVIDGHS